MIHILPSFHIYFESNSPLEHKNVLKDGIGGLYFSFQWIKWLFTWGIFIKPKN